MVTAVLAVLAGGLAGWFLHRPGTTTITRTTTAPAYSTAATVEGAVSFDGVHAYYSGPAEVRTGTVMTLRVLSSVPGAAVVVSRLSPAPGWAALTHDIATANTAEVPMPMTYVHHMATIDTGKATDVRFTRPGLYSIWAGPVSSPPSASVAIATVVRVTP